MLLNAAYTMLSMFLSIFYFLQIFLCNNHTKQHFLLNFWEQLYHHTKILLGLGDIKDFIHAM